MMGNGLMTRQMEREHIVTLMELLTRETGKKTYNMGMD